MSSFCLKMKEYEKKKWKNVNCMNEGFEKQKGLFYEKLYGRINYHQLFHQQLKIVYPTEKLFTK